MGAAPAKSSGSMAPFYSGTKGRLVPRSAVVLSRAHKNRPRRDDSAGFATRSTQLMSDQRDSRRWASSLSEWRREYAQGQVPVNPPTYSLVKITGVTGTRSYL